MHSGDDLVSVVMPVLDGGDLLNTALESIMNQDYAHFEVIVVDDGSTDGTMKILKSFSRTWPGRIKILTHPGGKRQGIAASYRLGLDNCQGKYIAFLEHDDFWPTNKISEQVKVFESIPEVGVVFSDVYFSDVRGRHADKAFKTLVNRPPSQRPFRAFWKLLWGNFVSTFSNIMVRHSQIDSSDVIAEPEGFQDWMLLLLLSSRCKFYHCNNTKVLWRQRQDSYHGKLRQLPEYQATYRKLRKLALINGIGKIFLEKQTSHSNGFFRTDFHISFWHFVISILSAAERVTDLLNRGICRKVYM